MKLHQKLILAIGASVFLPIVFGVLATFIVMHSQVSEVNRLYGTHLKTSNMFAGITEEVIRELTYEAMDGIILTAVSNPQNFLMQEYQNELNARLRSKHSYLIVRNRNQVSFFGGAEPDSYELPSYDEYIGAACWNEDLEGYIQRLNFSIDGITWNSIFVVTQIQPLLPSMVDNVIQIGLVCILVTIMTALIVSLITYRSIYKPIITLKGATHNIAEGNLDFQIENNSRDEIGELCEDFEFMRMKLKESSMKQIESDRQNQELVSNITHDLKTPITSIKGYVEGLIDGVAATPEKQMLYLKTIYSKSNDLNRLIDELTYYSKISNNRIPYTFTKLDIVSYFDDCIDELSMDFEASGVSFESENLCKESITVIADPIQLRKVVNNLIGNAVKYMDKPNPKVIMTLSETADEVTFMIQDNGKGIAQRDLAYIFDRFYRTDSARSSTKGGSGIGLAICKKIMEDHGGQIYARSIEGVGTSMYFTLKKHKEELHE